MLEIYGRFRNTDSFQLSNIRNHVKTNPSIYMLFFIFNLESFSKISVKFRQTSCSAYNNHRFWNII